MIIEAAIFDMDGLLLDSEPSSKKAWADACECFGARDIMGAFDLLIGTTVAGAKAALEGVFGVDRPIDEILEKQRSLNREYADRDGIPLKEGAVELLDWLADRGVKTALATSSSFGRAKKWLDNAGLFDRFDERVFGDEVTRSKPDPEIFLLAAAKLGVEPCRCVVFEDSYNGVNAAANAGMAAVMAPDMVPADDVIRGRCLAVVGSLLDAPDVIEGYLPKKD